MPNDDYEQSLRNFYSVLKEKLKSYREVKRHLDRSLSTDFNIFTWIKPDEKRLSNVIANLLNPTCSHGQQHVFLDAFLRRIGKDDLCDKQPRQVATEYHIENPEGYIDVLVDFGAFAIAIENKPWAKEGNKQLLRYSDYLSKEYNDQFCLIYLTLSGDKPESIDRDKRERLMKQGKLLCVSYHSHIMEWLRECCQLCESNKFREFLRDFMNYIPTMEGEMSNSSERDIILKHVLSNSENLETTLDIGFAFNELRKRIIVGFLDKLEEFILDRLADASEWKIDRSLVDSPLTTYSWFGFKKSAWNDKYGVALEPQSANAGDVIIGIWRQYDEKTGTGVRRIDPLFQELNNIRNGRHSDWWEWHHFLEDDYTDWNTKEALIKLHNGEAVEYIGKKFVEIIDKAAPIIDVHVRGSSS
ncbi:MAG: PD-(D/E)XK nuclease family protein [Nitrospira sp.]|nr:PD-(D/E)XK nuclease family protein [Nitrospira sp.]